MDVLRDSLRDNITFRKLMQEEYSYIMVDEYQDPNNSSSLKIFYISFCRRPTQNQFAENQVAVRQAKKQAGNV